MEKDKYYIKIIKTEYTKCYGWQLFKNNIFLAESKIYQYYGNCYNSAREILNLIGCRLINKESD